MTVNVPQLLNRLYFSLLIPIVSYIHFSLNIYRPGVRTLKTVLDDLIPLNSFFAIPYLYWFAYIFLALLFFAIVDGKHYFRLLFSIVTGMMACFVFFIILPTTVPRPEIYAEDILSQMVVFIYSMDNPYNCFPSIHVLNAVLVSLFLCSYAKQLLWDTHRKMAWVINCVSIVSCVSISLSTLFVKQHYVLDVAAASLLGLICYMVFNNETLWNSAFIKRFIRWIVPANNPDTM